MSGEEKMIKKVSLAKNVLHVQCQGGVVGAHSAQLCAKAQ